MAPYTLTTQTAGSRGALFWLALKSSVLTVLTLGIYRFWMKTRLRRFYWSAICPGGVPLEYTGTGIEKLMGFLVAVVVLAFYIGIVNLILVFLSFSLLNDNVAAYVLSFIGIIPIYFFASYRARRYVLARTRWRGLRFGIEPAAWAYAWRAMLHGLATLLTLGLLLPRQTFWLEKFRIDRTWFGQAKFTQEGNWKMLLPVARQMNLGIIFLVVSSIVGVVGGDPRSALLIIPAALWALLGFVHFQVQAFRILAEHKRLAPGIRFAAAPRTKRVIGIYSLGYALCGLILLFGLVLLFIGIFSLIYLAGAVPASGTLDFQTVLSGENGALWQAVSYAIGALIYFSVFIFWGVLRQIFVTLPLLRHYAQSTRLIGSHHLPEIRQRARDQRTGAEGFAEALDIGAAI